MQIGFPFSIDGLGCTATADEDRHARDLLEQVLFTSPGERVNQPDFGCGLMGLLFEPAGESLITMTQVAVQGALQRWLADVLQVQAVCIEPEDQVVRVTVEYVVLRTQQRKTAQFSREV